MLERAKWKLTSPIQLLISLYAAVKKTTKNEMPACCLIVEKRGQVKPAGMLFTPPAPEFLREGTRSHTAALEPHVD